jgi:nitrile hydratase accessory protein
MTEKCRTTVPMMARQPQSDGEPVFDAPWQARAFAMAVYLNETGVFHWSEWADRFSRRIAEFEIRDEISSSDAYYKLWLETLEAFV